MTDVSFALCDLVCMVGECVIDTAAMDIKILAQMLHRDAGALDVPAGISHSPGAVPLKLLVVELGLCKPENEVCLVSFVIVLFNALANAVLQVLLFKIMENVIVFKL